MGFSAPVADAPEKGGEDVEMASESLLPAEVDKVIADTNQSYVHLAIDTPLDVLMRLL
jgi:hypothetical protein